MYLQEAANPPTKNAEKPKSSKAAKKGGEVAEAEAEAKKPLGPNYGGLVHGHNPRLAAQFGAGEYPKMLEAAINELRYAGQGV